MPAILATMLLKTAANFTENSRKHVFAASNWRKKKKLQQIFPEIYSFLLHTLICIIKYV